MEKEKKFIKWTPHNCCAIPIPCVVNAISLGYKFCIVPSPLQVAKQIHDKIILYLYIVF